MPFDVGAVRAQFPILNTAVHGHPLVYLDNAATTQMPEPVLAVMEEQYRFYEANVHRGIHTLSERSTQRMEQARRTVQQFIHAAEPEEIVFTSGTTDAVNLAARSFCDAFLRPGDEILVTAMEHHSNFVPWQQACLRCGARLRVLPIDGDGELRRGLLGEYLTERTRLVAVCAVSNVLGTVNPVGDIIDAAHAVGARVFVDAAQAVRHGPIDVQALDCDFLAFSGHKLMGPTGTGVLYGKRELLERMGPVSFGGGMVDAVSGEETTFGELPFKFEAGTPNIAGNIALGAAVGYFQSLGEEAVRHERALLSYAEEQLRSVPGLEVLGRPRERSCVISFNLAGAHPFDVAALLDRLGVAVRSGHHCAQPLLRSLGLTGAVRVSPAYYNTFEEIDALTTGLHRIRGVLDRNSR